MAGIVAIRRPTSLQATGSRAGRSSGRIPAARVNPAFLARVPAPHELTVGRSLCQSTTEERLRVSEMGTCRRRIERAERQG